MWISREALAQAYEEKTAEGRRAERKEWEGKCKKFSEYYQERLEYWKERAKEELVPCPHALILCRPGTGSKLERFDDLSAMQKRHHELLAALETNNVGAIFFDGKTITPPLSLEEREGHPEPYSSAEIESWAKEKVEMEMRRWRVVTGEMSLLELIDKIRNCVNSVRRLG